MEQGRPLDILSKYRQELREYGVKSLSLFGSAARGEARADSDLDILVEFTHPIGLLAFLRLKHRLEDILRRPIDLVTPQALKPQLRHRILEEAAHAGQGLEV